MKYWTGLLLIAIASCQQPNKPQEKPTPAPATTMQDEHKFDVSLVNNKKDPVCGMPVTAGISDTLHTKDKVYGFCSKDCKALYIQHPKEYTVELKK